MSEDNKNNFIAGQWVRGLGDAFASHDPYTSDIVWQGHGASVDELNKTIQAAHDALISWRNLGFEKRCEIAKKFADGLRETTEELATVIATENGKPFWEAKTEVGAMINKIDLSIAAVKERCATTSSGTTEKHAETRYKSHGVVAVFGPFNFPCHLANGHIVPALLLGNAVVFKPSELTPAVATKTVKLWQKAGLPEGVLSLVHGDHNIGKALITHKDINGVFFTGSTATGLAINQALASRPQVIVALEMGGNNPLVVWDQHDPNSITKLIIQSAYLTAGQRCTCARRLIIPEGKVGDAIIASLTQALPKMITGHYTQHPEPFMGPVISAKAASFVMSKQDEYEKRGGIVIVRSKQDEAHAAMISPGLIDMTNVQHRRDEEIFGPFLQVIRVKKFEDAITVANDTAFGLAAGLVCEDPNKFDVFYNKIQAGIVNWNNQLTGASSSAPFGGVGLSGNHRPSAYFAADYCAYPVATLQSEQAKDGIGKVPGLDL